MSTNTKFPLRIQILNISSNLTRLGEWAAGDFQQRLPLIVKFLDQTEEYLADLNNQSISNEFKPTQDLFIKEFDRLKNQRIDSRNKDQWAEKALTWANILQHRSKLVQVNQLVVGITRSHHGYQGHQQACPACRQAGQMKKRPVEVNTKFLNHRFYRYQIG